MSAPVNRHVIAFLTFIGLLPLVYFIPPAIAQAVSSDQLVVTVLAVAVIVPIISYFWLPFALKVISRLKLGDK